LDYWASKHILIPAAIAKRYTAYSSLDPDYEPVTGPLTESFHNYLERSMNELKKNGFQVTMNEDEMNVYVRRAGATPDLNKDGIVNILDITIVAVAFNSKPGNSNWNPTADLDGNSIVNIIDIAIVAEQYGRTMTTIFEDGFESGGASAWSWTTGTPAVVSDVQHHGTYSGKFGHDICYVAKADLAHDTLYTRIYARIDTLPPSDKLVLVLRGEDSGGSVMYELYFYNNAGTLTISLGTKKPTGMRLDYKFAYSTNTWICLEVEYYRHATNGEYRFWVNGVAAGSRTGLDTATGIGLHDHVVAGQVWSNYAVSVWVDCVTVSDAYIEPEASN
jgi:hypothetical protein